jgi:4-hydroxy-tetrahydrodipicolinate reductase
MIKLALIGYGQMGKLLEKIAAQHNAEIVAIIDPLLNNSITSDALKEADVCIEFTNPTSVISNIKQLASFKKNIVVGTTGWADQISEVEKSVRVNNIGLIYGANFSVGMNLFLNLTDHLSILMNNLTEYDAWGLEKHHNKKVDSPSGTAKMITDILVQNLDSKQTGQFNKLDRRIKPEELHFASIRSGNIPGEHIVGFDSAADSIEIKHTARNREGLAIGTLKAAHWINHKKGLHNFRDVFQQLIEKGNE